MNSPDSHPFHPAIDELQHPELAIWRANVGAPVALDLAPAAAPGVTHVDVLSWNLAIGEARLAELVDRLRNGELCDAPAATPARPLMILAQEAYRADVSVPAAALSRRHGGKARGRGRTDIVATARELGFSLRYAPSMRNGRHPSDRGNALLSSAALGTAHACLLPYVRQRRVVVSAELRGIEGVWFTSAHLDVGGQPERGRIGPFGSGRVSQTLAKIAHLLELNGDVVIGADLNSHLGLRDPVLTALFTAGFRTAEYARPWRHTFHGPLRLLLDHVLWHAPTGRIRAVRVNRIDERGDDRTRRIFGSDHHPLFATVELEPVRSATL